MFVVSTEILVLVVLLTPVYTRDIQRFESVGRYSELTVMIGLPFVARYPVRPTVLSHIIGSQYGNNKHTIIPSYF